MVVLTRSSLPWVPHTWVSGTDPLQTPRAWFWGTHKWAISAALLAGEVSRTVDNVLVFGPPLHRGIERRSLCQSSWDGYSVCSGLFWGERWWSVGCRGSWWSASWFGLYPPVLQWKMAFFLLRIKVLDFIVWQMWCELLLFPSVFCKLICYFFLSFSLMSVCAGIHWRITQAALARVLMFPVSFFCLVSGSPDMRACRAASEAVRKTAFLGFSSHEMMVSVAFSSAWTSAP